MKELYSLQGYDKNFDQAEFMDIFVDELCGAKRVALPDKSMITNLLLSFCIHIHNSVVLQLIISYININQD